MKDSDPAAISENRQAARVPVELKTVVQVKESDEETWKEVITVTTISRSGASFMLSRPCAVAKLVALVLPMPPELRAYDHHAEVYPVMGLVQYCNESTVDDVTKYHVGVAFIGKQVPDSYKADPRQSYMISGMDAEGLWRITEAESTFKTRGHSRFWLAIDVSLTLIGKEKGNTVKEDAVTQNVSARGASVKCSLQAVAGDKVKFACKALDFYAIALVRNRKQPADAPATLHLEFIDDQFPIDKIYVNPKTD